MTRLESSRDRVGAVYDPQTGELVQLGTDIDRSIAERCADSFSHLEVTGVTHPTNEDGEPLCVGKEDGQCSRVVDEPGESCWQH